MPSQYSMASRVVAFRVAPLSPCSTGRTGSACTPSASAVRLAGEQRARLCRCHAPRSQRSCGCRGRGSGKDRTSVPGSVQAGTSCPSIRHRRLATYVVGGRDVRGGWALAVRAQYTTEAGFACEVDPLVGQRRDDPRPGGVSAKRGSLATAMIRARSASLKACDGTGRVASGRRSPCRRPSPAFQRRNGAVVENPAHRQPGSITVASRSRDPRSDGHGCWRILPAAVGARWKSQGDHRHCA
jgi:hypothetical protein